MGITVLKIVIWGSKSSDLQSQIPLFRLQNCLFTSPNEGVVGWCEGVMYLVSLGRPTDIGLHLGKACYR